MGAEILLAAAAFAAGFFMGQKRKMPKGEGVYMREYGRTNGLYEPIRRD